MENQLTDEIAEKIIAIISRTFIEYKRDCVANNKLLTTQEVTAIAIQNLEKEGLTFLALFGYINQIMTDLFNDPKAIR